MDELNWMLQTSPDGQTPAIVSYYLLNNLGVFTKRERRISKKAPLTAVTGFRVGFTVVPGKDYRAAPMDRNAILWHKITSVKETRENSLTVKGNAHDEIELSFNPEYRDAVLRYIATMRLRYPAVAAADEKAAAWICWRDDDDWDDPFLPLSEMVKNELNMRRYIEPEVLSETELAGTPNVPEPAAAPVTVKENKRSLCSCCGAALNPDAKFCGKCGTRVR
ncbi:MAG: zinc ribbon domain-containing protein [Eubacteriales bacterium]